MDSKPQTLFSLAYIFAADRIGLCLFQFLWCAVKTACRVRNGCLKSCKVLDFGTNRKRVCNVLLVINSNFGSILPNFRDIASFLLKIATSHLFHMNFYRAMHVVQGAILLS